MDADDRRACVLMGARWLPFPLVGLWAVCRGVIAPALGIPDAGVRCHQFVGGMFADPRIPLFALFMVAAMHAVRSCSWRLGSCRADSGRTPSGT